MLKDGDIGKYLILDFLVALFNHSKLVMKQLKIKFCVALSEFSNLHYNSKSYKIHN